MDQWTLTQQAYECCVVCGNPTRETTFPVPTEEFIADRCRTESANKLGTKCEHEDRYWELMGWLKIADIISVDSLRFPVWYDGDFITSSASELLTGLE